MTEQHVATLAVGVVGDHIEHGHPPQCIMCLWIVFEDGEVVLTMVGVDEPLDRALAIRARAHDGWRHNSEAHGFAELVRGDLAAVETSFEIPQGPLALQRFVNALADECAVAKIDQERGIAAVGHAPFDVDLAALE